MRGFKTGRKGKLSGEEVDKFLNGLEIARAEFPSNLCAKYMTKEMFNSYSKKEREQLYKICKSGYENKSSKIGAYAMSVGDYDTFSKFFDPLIRDFHKSDLDGVPNTDWDISELGEDGAIDFAKYDLSDIKMQVRVIRNLQNPFTGNMTKEDRISMEKSLTKWFDKLIARPEFGGQIYSLSPDLNGKKNPNLVTEDDFEALVDQGILFTGMDDDPYLKSAGIAEDWPYGRGCYVSNDSNFIIWYGEEDHLKFVSRGVGTRFDEVFSKLQLGLHVFHNLKGVRWAYSDKYGYITSCPSNLGTGMRVSVNVAIPNLTRGGRNLVKAREVAAAHGLNFQGAKGEHSLIGPGGNVEVFPRKSLYASEKEMVQALYEGVEKLLIDEKAAIIWRGQSSMELLERNKKYDSERLPPKLLNLGNRQQKEKKKKSITPDLLGKPKAKSTTELLARAESAELHFSHKLLSHVAHSPTPFHCCATMADELERAGFVRLQENVPWRENKLLKPCGKYYLTRNGSTLLAFCIGGKFKVGNPFKIVGAHTDSPALKLKPKSGIKRNGWLQVAVECYGSGLWHTWLDRDLGIAGRCIVKAGAGYRQAMVHINKPILRIPSPATQEGKGGETLQLNKEEHLMPILGLVSEDLNNENPSIDEIEQGYEPKSAPALLRLLGSELKCKPEDILDFELSLCDTQLPAIGGINNELVLGPRLHNQVHSFTSIEALMHYSTSALVSTDGDVSMCCLFDHEEGGSQSAQGARSHIVRDIVQRISSSFGSHPDVELVNVSLSQSILISADGAHGVHPNYASNRETQRKPEVGKGTVLKTNQNQRYATNAITGFLVREICRRNRLPFQESVLREDTTAGPIAAAEIGIRNVDIGVPQLSMHSIRETCAVRDVYSNSQLLTAFFAEGTKIEESLNVEDKVQRTLSMVERRLSQII